MTTKKQQILDLGGQGVSYSKIAEQVGCSKGTISYHLGEGVKQKTNARRNKNRAGNPLARKVDDFMELSSRERHRMLDRVTNFHSEHNLPKKGLSLRRTFTPEDIISTLGNTCYLTGRLISYNDPTSYQLDHKVPRAKGGARTLENCGLACKQANAAKSDMLLEEFFQLCIDVVKFNNLRID